jgi:hypothetical protein
MGPRKVDRCEAEVGVNKVAICKRKNCECVPHDGAAGPHMKQQSLHQHPKLLVPLRPSQSKSMQCPSYPELGAGRLALESVDER